MIIHTVRKPFMCWEGQFTPGKRDLCIGLDLNTVKGNKYFRCYIGANRKVYYEIESAEVLRLLDEYKQEWKNEKGKNVVILPIKDFKRIESKWDKTEYEKKEEKREQMKDKVRAENPTLF